MGTDPDVTEAWDQIREPAPDLDMEPIEIDPARTPLEPSRLSLVGGAWGDLVTMLGVCTATFIALAMLGYDPHSAAFLWALALGVVWWSTAAAVLLVVRQGTPGMLLTGTVFEDAVPRERVGWVMLAALALCGTLGVPAILGAHASPLRLAAGVDLVVAASLDASPA
jgi:hypothetical protein